MADDMVGEHSANRTDEKYIKKNLVTKRVGKLLLAETDVSKLVDNIIIYFKPQDIKIRIFCNLTFWRRNYFFSSSTPCI